MTAGAAWPNTWRASTAPLRSTCATCSRTQRCDCSPWAPTTAPPRGPSSTPCGCSCARVSPRARSASRPGSPTRRACTRVTTNWWSSAASSPAAATTARTTATTACTHCRATPIRSRSRAGPACPLHLAHAHLGFACNRGRAPELLALIDAARAEGVDITLDSYPYLAGATYLHALLPGWAHAGGPEATIARLRDPDLRERLRFELEEQGSDGFHDVPVEWDKLVLDGVLDRRSRRARRASGRSTSTAMRAPSRASRQVAWCISATRRTCGRPCSTRRTRPAATASSSASGRTRAAGAPSRATSPSTSASWEYLAWRSASAT